MASILLLPLACGLLGVSLDRAYSASLIDSQQRQMILQSYALMASAELDDDTLWLPEVMADDRLNQISSGMFAHIFREEDGALVWKSASSPEARSIKSLESIEGFQFEQMSPGDHTFGLHDTNGENLFFLYYKVNWENAQGFKIPFVFSIYESAQGYAAQLKSYRHTLWLWLGVITVSLLCLQTLIMWWGLKPVNKVAEDLNAVKAGEAKQLDGDYPNELKGMTSSINRLINHEAEQRERYRNTLADLAHSIKNPVTIITGTLEALRKDNDPRALDEISEQNQRINQIISYQLTRAVGQSAAPFHQAIPVKPIVEKVVSAMSKVYAEKQLEIDFYVDDEASFRGDLGDLMELIGNLLDNACKYGDRKVLVKFSENADFSDLIIEDDGVGISAEEKERLLKRGQRADTSLPGQGIGLAVVEDIVRSYGGTLELASSSLGGLNVLVRF